MAAARGSRAIVNRSGERGHPCCVPLERSKNYEVTPFVMTAALGELYIIFIHLLKPAPKPNPDRAECRKPHSTLSKAFSASNEIAATGAVLEEFSHIKCKSLRKLSVEDLPFIKPTWSVCIMYGKLFQAVRPVLWPVFYYQH